MHMFIAVILISFFFPKIPGIWEKIDIAIFRFFNLPLFTSRLVQTLWALANHKLADWVEDFCILGFYLLAIFRTAKQKRLQRTCEFIFCILLTACTLFLINFLVCRDLLSLRRKSPSLIFPSTIPISEQISWVSIKKRSIKSFPGDHATTAFLFACSYAWFVRGRLAVLAIMYASFLCLPRLAVGAHWFSDIIVGSGCIVLFAFTWAFFTPLADCCTKGLQRLFFYLKFKEIQSK